MFYFIIISFVGLCLAFESPDAKRSAIETHDVDGVDAGKWEPVEMCPDGSFASAMELKHDGVTNFMNTRSIDDESATGVRFFCHIDGVFLPEAWIGSGNGHGTWQGINICPNEGRIIGMRANFDNFVSMFQDDLGIEDIRVLCNDGTVIDGLSGMVRHENIDDLRNGIEVSRTQAVPFLSESNWGAWEICTTGMWMCGLQTRYKDGSLSDAQGLTQLTFYCCT